MLETILFYTGIATWIVIIAWLLLRLIFGENWMLKVGSGLFLGTGLMQSAKKLKNEIKERDIKDDTVTEVAVRVFWRLTRIGLIGLIIAGLPVWLLLQQNRLIDAQNKLFRYQNDKVAQQTDLLQSQDKRLELQNRLFASQNDLFTDQNQKIDLQSELFQDQNYLIGLQKVQADSQISLLAGQNSRIDTQNYRINLQNNLMEADRRGALIILMSNILDQVNSEIEALKKVDQAKYDSIGYYLSDPLIGRIAALSQGFLPYRFLTNDTLTEKAVSPERGQLLLALVKSNLDSITYGKVNRSSNFERAYLNGADLSGANLNGINLVEADLIGANLGGTYLSRADLSGANLKAADLMEVNLIGANLIGADLGGTYLSRADLSGANISGADLIGADLIGANLEHADLSGTDINHAKLTLANLNYADLSAASLIGAILVEADLRRAYLRGASLVEADLSRAYLSRAYLRGADLSRADLRETRDLKIDQLKAAKSLYNCTGLNSILVKQLKREKHCLFTEDGCRE